MFFTSFLIWTPKLINIKCLLFILLSDYGRISRFTEFYTHNLFCSMQMNMHFGVS